ncbi:MAG: GDP-mannose 4,6-dehydratase, partial [Bradymonadaceae bacterium]
GELPDRSDLDDEWEVVAFRHYNSASNRGNLEYLDLEGRENFEFAWGDLRDAESVDSAMGEARYVFHLGAIVAIPYSYVNPRGFVETNVEGTQNVLEAARRRDDIERVVVTSTSEVYGTAQYVPIDEEHPLQGQSPYSASKIGADHLAESYYRSFDVPVGILRPFNTYGPRQSMRAIIPTIISQLLTRDVVELGNLSPRRDLTFVEDTVEGFVRMATEEVPYGEPINIGNGSDISIGELFELLRDLTGSDAELQTDEQRVRPEKSEVMRLLSDPSKAQETIGWEPNHSLEQGLEKTIAWVREHSAGMRADEYHI